MQAVNANTAVRVITRYWRRNRPSARLIRSATPPDPAAAADPVAAFTPVHKVATPGAGRAKERIEFALVGAGNLAKWEHLPNIKKLPGVGLRAVYSAGGVRGKSYALRFGASYACSEYEEVLKYKNGDLYDLALFKSAWTLWRLGRTEEAAQRFLKVFQATEDGPNNRGKSRQELDELVAG